MNTLYYGDNLDVLRNKIKDDTVDLCYIDPPFNSKRNYFQIYNNVGKEDRAQTQAFIDTWTWNELADSGLLEIISNDDGRYTRQTVELIKGLRAVLGAGGLLSYLISMTQRINEIWRVLKPTGSFYLHCDPTCSHYLKLVLDSVFCPRGGNYLNDITWKRTNNPKGSQFKDRKYGVYTDVLLFYTKSAQYTFNLEQIRQPLTPEELLNKYPKTDERGRYLEYPILRSASKGPRPNLVYEYKGFTPPQWGWVVNPVKLAAIDQRGDLGWRKNGMPYRKYRITEDRGIPIGNLWDDVIRIQSNSKETLGYPTQKPESLLERIITASSNEGDLVLDAYCGCGTTVAVAQRLHRQWIGIDITYQSIALILRRLEDSFGADVINQITLGGIPRDMDSARALANKKDDRLRKEFEKWAVLTYSKNRAAVNDKKGADKGIDGVAYIAVGLNEQDTVPVIFQVKSGKVKRSDIATLNSDRLREQAAIAFLITLEEPTKPMLEEALQTGRYIHPLLNQNYPCVQIISIRQLIEDGARIELPSMREVLKTAPVAAKEQRDLGLE